MELMIPVKDKGYALIDNFERVIETSNLSRILFGIPIWKHIYHALYWFDYWFAGPDKFIGAPFHVEQLDSIDSPVKFDLTKEQLIAYCNLVSDKSKAYLDGLTDEMLTERPAKSDTNRLGLILSQFRHAYAHIGNINCTTIMDTNKWPLVAGNADDIAKGLYE